MEAMMREIREGTKYLPVRMLSGKFFFTNKDLDTIKYELNTGGYIERTKGTDAPE